MKTLDLSRPYGSICGTGVNYRFEQDGLFFNGQGNQVVEGAAAAAPDAPAPLADMLDQSVAAIVPLLSDLAPAQLEELKAAEQGGKTRKGLMAAIDEEIAKRSTVDDQLAAQMQ